jgi:hypothetical protein
MSCSKEFSQYQYWAISATVLFSGVSLQTMIDTMGDKKPKNLLRLGVLIMMIATVTLVVATGFERIIYLTGSTGFSNLSLMNQITFVTHELAFAIWILAVSITTLGVLRMQALPRNREKQAS